MSSLLATFLVFLCIAGSLLGSSQANAVVPGSRQSLASRLEKANESRPRGISLVLSGGGAKGFAHIGLLDVFDSAGIPIEIIVGTSMGASIGGLYAIGYSPKELEEFASSTNWAEVLGLTDDSRSERFLNRKNPDNALLSLRFTGFFEPVIPQALSSGQRLTMLISKMVMGAPWGVPSDFIRDTRVPFIAVATDIVSGERRLISQGDLTSALRASATLPLRFDPVTSDTSILMDGGLLSNIPVDVVKDSLNGQIVVVNNTTAGLHARSDLNTPWDVADQVITMMMRRMTAPHLARADMVVTPEFDGIEGEDFSRASEIIERGRVAARRMLPILQARLNALQELLRTQVRQAGDTLISRVNSIDVHLSSTLTAGTRDRLRALRLQGALLRSQAQATLERPVLEILRDEGLSLARIDSVVIKRGNGSVHIFVDAGHIAELRVRGNAYVHPDVVTRDFPLAAGDVFRSSAAEQGLSNITNSGYFDFAALELLHDSSWEGTYYTYAERDSFYAVSEGKGIHGTGLVISVRPKPANVIKLAVLADNEYGALFSTKLANENVLGTGTEIAFRGSLGPTARGAALAYDAPRLFTTNVSFFSELYSSYRDMPNYSTRIEVAEGKLVTDLLSTTRESRDFGWRIRLGGEVSRLAGLQFEFRNEDQRWYTLGEDNPHVERLRLRTFKTELILDSRNDASYASRGTFLGGYFETAVRAVGSELSYTKLVGYVEPAIPISALHTIQPRLLAGYGDITLPRLEYFRMGGMNTFYGLADNELRGRQIFQASLGYQIAIPHALFFPTFVSFRYDLGAMWQEPQTIKFEALVHGVGAQVGVSLPFGLARFGIGENFRFHKNEKKPLDLNTPRFYFYVGSTL